MPLAPPTPLVPVPDVGTDELSPSALVVVNGPEPGPDPGGLPPLFGGWLFVGAAILIPGPGPMDC